MSPTKTELGQAYECLSCGGVYYPDQPGGYFHQCPDDTLFPRDENWKDDKDPKPKKGKERDKGGAKKVTV